MSNSIIKILHTQLPISFSFISPFPVYPGSPQNTAVIKTLFLSVYCIYKFHDCIAISMPRMNDEFLYEFICGRLTTCLIRFTAKMYQIHEFQLGKFLAADVLFVVIQIKLANNGIAMQFDRFIQALPRKSKYFQLCLVDLDFDIVQKIWIFPMLSNCMKYNGNSCINYVVFDENVSNCDLCCARL